MVLTFIRNLLLCWMNYHESDLCFFMILQPKKSIYLFMICGLLFQVTFLRGLWCCVYKICMDEWAAEGRKKKNVDLALHIYLDSSYILKWWMNMKWWVALRKGSPHSLYLHIWLPFRDTYGLCNVMQSCDEQNGSLSQDRNDSWKNVIKI